MDYEMISSTKEGYESFVDNVDCGICCLEELCTWNSRVNGVNLCDYMSKEIYELELKMESGEYV